MSTEEFDETLQTAAATLSKFDLGRFYAMIDPQGPAQDIREGTCRTGPARRTPLVGKVSCSSAIVHYLSFIGQDLGRTGGFAVYSFNAGWRVASRALLTAGVDNVFDQTYAEHLSRSGGGVTGYPITTRINEPGRTLWLTFSTAL